MKNYITLLLGMIMLSALSCNPDEDNKPSDNRLMGTWNGQTQYELGYQDGKMIYADTIHITSPDYYKLNFKSQNKLEVHTFIGGVHAQESESYTIDGDQLTISDGADPETYTFQIEGKELRLVLQEVTSQNGHTIKQIEKIEFIRE